MIQSLIPIPLLIALLATTAHAELISGLTVVDGSSNPFNPEIMGPAKAINGAGLPGNEPSLTGTHSTDFSDHWWTWPIEGVDAVKPQLTIALNVNYVLNTIQIWNYNEGGVTERSTKNMEIYVSADDNVDHLVKLTTDGTGEHDNLTGDFLLPQAPGDPSYTGFVLDLKGVTNAALLGNVRLIRFNPLDSFDISAGIGLAEIQFAGTPVPASHLFQLVITPSGGNYDFSWDSRSGKRYDLVTSLDLTTPILEWPVYSGHENMPATPPRNTLESVASPDSKRFFAMIEKDIPPVFTADFEDDNGGFTAVGTPNDWAWGAPNSRIDTPPLTLNTGNEGSTRCWGTNLGDGGANFGSITAGANSVLRSPNIDLSGITGAQLTFAAAVDATATDTLEVRVNDVATGDLLTVINPITLPDTAPWKDYGPFDLSIADGKVIRIDFNYQGASGDYIGFYLDDVSVTVK